MLLLLERGFQGALIQITRKSDTAKSFTKSGLSGLLHLRNSITLFWLPAVAPHLTR
jgi:hypothetical protein